ncbi:unnamed protein product [Caenorhabditis angaria]|uniref:Uncharacterized protein n=1 Tax=Caenorhabditis angaria TaxID=860376 RepID=A0A9P1IAN4_9PELO|nr:unnamed protein product [Caenorhabditis angaria]
MYLLIFPLIFTVISSAPPHTHIENSHPIDMTRGFANLRPIFEAVRSSSVDNLEPIRKFLDPDFIFECEGIDYENDDGIHMLMGYFDRVYVIGATEDGIVENEGFDDTKLVFKFSNDGNILNSAQCFEYEQ